jgi:GAF domain-containing protein
MGPPATGGLHLLSPRPPKLPVIVTLDPSLVLAAESPSSRLKALFDLGKRLLEREDPEQVMLGIHETILDHFMPERSCVLRVTRDGSVRPISSTGFNLTGPQENWALSQPVMRKVRDTGHSVLATDVMKDAPEEGAPHRPKLRLCSVLCAPLGRAPVRGLLYLDSREGRGRTYHRDDLDFLTALSVHASLIVDRAYALARAKKATDVQ